MPVASTDGVGTKLKIAQSINRHDTVRQDIVNHCVNDILVMVPNPVFLIISGAENLKAKSLLTISGIKGVQENEPF